MKFAVEVDVMPHSEISDPQGQTIERALPKIGFSEIESVRVGKHLELIVDAPDEDAAREIVQQASNRFLTNPVIEEFRFRVKYVVSA